MKNLFLQVCSMIIGEPTLSLIYLNRCLPCAHCCVFCTVFIFRCDFTSSDSSCNISIFLHILCCNSGILFSFDSHSLSLERSIDSLSLEFSIDSLSLEFSVDFHFLSLEFSVDSFFRESSIDSFFRKSSIDSFFRESSIYSFFRESSIYSCRSLGRIAFF